VGALACAAEHIVGQREIEELDMPFEVSLTNPALIERFEPYFKHPDPNRYVLRRGDSAVACKNAKTALAALGFARAFGDDPQLYDQQLHDAVERFQTAPVLIYLRLDDTPPKAHDPHRIAINGQGKTLKQIGVEIQKSLDMPVQHVSVECRLR
jgi:hypothetical protein